jgi:hypothetical protein
LWERRAWHRRSGPAAAITVTDTTAIDIASDTTMTIDIIAGDTPAAQGLSTAADAFVRGASAYKTASANHIVATEVHLEKENTKWPASFIH